MTNRAAADGLTPGAAIDRIELAIPPRPQDRRLHARGAVYDARFVPLDRSTTSPSPRICETKPPR